MTDEYEERRVDCPGCGVTQRARVHVAVFGGQIRKEHVEGKCSVCETPLDVPHGMVDT